MGNTISHTYPMDRNGPEMEREDMVIDAEFEEVRKTLSTERSAQIPAQGERKGPVSVGRPCSP